MCARSWACLGKVLEREVVLELTSRWNMGMYRERERVISYSVEGVSDLFRISFESIPIKLWIQAL